VAPGRHISAHVAVAFMLKDSTGAMGENPFNRGCRARAADHPVQHYCSQCLILFIKVVQ
jgi:hypothetical protein